MNDAGEILRLFRPIWRGLPLILAFMTIAILSGLNYLYKAVPTYQTYASLKINDNESGASEFFENFEPFSTTGQLLTEVEVIRSRYLVRKAVQKMNLDYFYYRFEGGVPRMMYQNSPYDIDLCVKGEKYIGALISFSVDEAGNIMLMHQPEDESKIMMGYLGVPFITPDFEITISLKSREKGKIAIGQFGVSKQSIDRLVSQFSDKKVLTVRLLAEDIAIVKIYFTHEVPRLARDYVNQLAQTYIDDFIENKTESAKKALNFIDEQLDKVTEDLFRAEQELAQFKERSQLVDFKLVADAKLRTLQDLETKQLNLLITNRGLDKLILALSDSTMTSKQSLNYEAIADAAYIAKLNKISDLMLNKENLLKTYTPTHPSVTKLDEEISRLKAEVLQSVQKTRATNQDKIDELRERYEQVSTDFSALPNVERKLNALTREFIQNEKAYNRLLDKRSEAAIGAASTISFHKIIEKAKVPKNHLHPQSTIIMSIAVVLGILLAVVIIYTYTYLKGAISNVKHIEDYLDIPLIAVITKQTNKVFDISQDFINLVTRLRLKHNSQMVVITSYTRKEGRKAASFNLARAFASIGYKTLLVDADFYKPAIHKMFELESEEGLGKIIIEKKEIWDYILKTPLKKLDFLPAGQDYGTIPSAVYLNPYLSEVMDELRDAYEYIIINGPGVGDNQDIIPLMKGADMNLIIIRSDRTRFTWALKMERLLKVFEINTGHFVLNKWESRSRKIEYKVNEEGKLPPMGQGVRRKLLRDTWAELMPTFGSGARRRLLWKSIKVLFGIRS